MAQPVIGITLDHRPHGGYSDFPWYALRQNYCDAVMKAGGVPFIIPYSQDHVDFYLDRIQGLLMPGGVFDVDPKMYGQTSCHEKVSINPARCTFDVRILTEALRRQIPFLGICAGQQMLNVALGGTLHQHIPDAIPGALEHEQKIPKNLPSHPIIIQEKTRLFEMAGTTLASVNSTHHQAVNQLGKSLTACAHAPDGIVEAIEITDHPFCLGVEWHPEYQHTELDRTIFQHFIKAASCGTHC
jgi:putative glutamine amidotransferase